MAIISDKNLISLGLQVIDVPGDFVEIGVFRGSTFKRLASLAYSFGKKSTWF